MTGASPADSLADLVAAQSGLDWTEAVAIVADLCDAIVARDPAAVHFPDAADVSVDANGTMAIARNPQSHDVAYGALLLQGLLGASVTPPPLRLFVTRALESTTHASVAEFAKALAYYERPGRAALVQQAIQKFGTGARRGTEAKAASVPHATKSADRVVRKTPRKNRFAIVAGVAVAVAIGAAIILFRFVGLGTAALPPSMTQLVAQATDALTTVSDRVRTRLGLASNADAPATAPESASVDAPAARSRTPQARGAPPTAESQPGSPSSDGAPPAEAAAVPSSEVAAPPVPAESSDGETPVDNLVYSSQSTEVVPPRLVDAGTLPSAALNAAPTDTVEVVVDRNGQVQQVKLLTGSKRMTDVMLLSAAKAWRFSPALRNGQPVQYRLVLNWSTVTRR